MKLVIQMPALNEEATIEKVISKIPKEFVGIDQVEVLVVNDGSTDKTAELALSSGSEVVSHEHNKGVGAAFQTGIAKSLEMGADIIVNMDSDGQFNPEDIPSLLAPILSGKAHMVTATRFKDPKMIPQMPKVKIWGNKRVAGMVRFLTNQKFTDVSCGFRAFSKEAALKMNLFGTFTYTQETFLDLAFKNLKIVEVPVPVRGVREFGKSRVASNLFRYAFRSSQIMLRAFIDYNPFCFFASISIIFFAVSLGLLGFLLMHYISTGSFSPHIWAGFVGGSFAFMGILTVVIGFLSDMMARLRRNQEDILFHLKKLALREKNTLSQ